MEKNKIKNFVIITNLSIFKKEFKLYEKKINLININNEIINYDNKKINILNIKTKNKYSNSLDSLNIAYKLTKDKYFIVS